MAVIINEQHMIEDNVFKYESRLNSQLNRFLDKTPTFVTYYHINDSRSTVDDGFQDAEIVIGERSPIKFNRIESFPIYGIESIIIQLEDTEFGIDGSYEGDAILLPNTVKPVENDYFIINHLSHSDSYIFRVISADYDNIKANNYYKISFKLEFIDDEKLIELNNQVITDYDCIITNIGTENKCIIEKESVTKLKDIDIMFDKVFDLYITLFYNDRYNSLLYRGRCGSSFYDPLLAMFLNRNNILNYHKNNLSTYILNIESDDVWLKLKYEKSIYRFVETLEINRLSSFQYRTYPATHDTTSAFSRWHDESVRIIEIGDVEPFNVEGSILTDQFIKEVITKDINDDDLIIKAFIKKFMSSSKVTIDDINSSLYDSIISSENSIDLYFFIPIILYIIKNTKEKFLSE